MWRRASEARRLAGEIAQDEHPDAPRLAPCGGLEDDLPRLRARRAQGVDDRLDLRCLPASEEGQRDVEVLPGHDPSSGEVLGSPPLEDVERRRAELESQEEPEAVISPDATRRGHTPSCRLRVKTRRARWSAATVALDLIAWRSPGTVSSCPLSPSGVETW